MGRKAHPLAARIKKMMQTDEDVGKIAQATPVMIARAMELFLQRLCGHAAEVAVSRKAKTLTTSHIKSYVASDELMDFLQDTVAKAPDLPPEGEPEAPKPKRQRTEKRDVRTSTEGKRGSADGGPAAAAAAAAAAAPPPPPPPPAVPADAGAQHQQHEEGGSPTAHAAHGKLGHGFGGLGAHPFLAARSFGTKPSGGPAARKAPRSSGSPKPESPAHNRQQQQQQQEEDEDDEDGKPHAAAAAACDEASPRAADAKMQPQQVQQQQLPVMLSVHALASFTKQEDDFEDDYDS